MYTNEKSLEWRKVLFIKVNVWNSVLECDIQDFVNIRTKCFVLEAIVDKIVEDFEVDVFWWHVAKELLGMDDQWLKMLHFSHVWQILDGPLLERGRSESPENYLEFSISVLRTQSLTCRSLV